ncbi:hypothetical protein PR202_gb12252 [Eleusine coracana subsp. coracana]|uniref:C3HC-type domain-containing protein n=1 Tax=Eleusine coracana subsp. coracana TaxID=191504 RepID=A0AAV5EMB7_ELECO|nr:hypothetical protein PR202_gb12252 [Eleusine coracana subsp. coracana]
MREEVRSSSAAPPDRPAARSASPPPTPVASSAGPSSPPGQTNVAIDWLGADQVSKVGSSHVAPDACQPSLSTNAVGTAAGFCQPSCRPWERGDLLRRLATYKPSTWASKPKAACSLACARRGWVNIDVDKIEFWNSYFTNALTLTLTFANAGEAFAEQLDASHQSDCPWRGNSCPDSLVQFHLTPSALVGGFKDRCDGLLQFASLPVISPSTIDSMKLTRGAEIELVLSQSVAILSGEPGRKPVLTRGVSATSGINGGHAADAERDNVEGRDEERAYGGKSLSNAQLDLNLTMAGGLPSRHSALPPMPGQSFGGMGKDLVIGQPTGSELAGHAASFESRGPSSRKRNLEEGGSTADKPINRLQPANSIEGTVIDRDGDEVDDAAQDSGTRSKRHRGFNLFDINRPSSSGAGPSRNLSFDLDIDANRFDTSKAEGPSALQNPSARDSMRASSVIAMDIVHNVEENSMESVEYHPCDVDDVTKPSSVLRSAGTSEALDLNYSNQAQQSSFVQPASESNAREREGSSMNAGEEVLNAEVAPAFAKDELSLGVSGGSVGMGASHEAEIHGIDVSEHKTCSVVGDADPVPELTETMGNTGESAPGPGLMDESAPEEVDREDPNGDSQDMASRLAIRADSGSKVCGSTRADSVESGEKLTLDAIEKMQYGQAQNQTMQSDSAASLYKDDHAAPSRKLLKRTSHSKC